ncbi:MAG: ATP-binding protein [Promethearchaeota archaeon]
MFVIAFSVYMFWITFDFKNKYQIKLNYPSRAKSRKGTIKIGNILYESKSKHSFFIDMDDLAQHVFICGVTGSGKSNFLQNFLINFISKYDINFLLNEFKGEYHFLQNEIKDLLIIKPGENFSINIFDPEGSDPHVHAERVFQIFESGGLLEGIEYSPQMERVFVDILKIACSKAENRNWESFHEISEQYYLNANDLTFKKSIIAIENRIRRYLLGSLKHIFVQKSKLKVRELFNHKVLLDLSSIIRLGGEKEDALFFLNMILKYLWDKNISIGSKNFQGIKHITIIEDAQYFAPEQLSNRTKLTSYIEDIALLLRGTGECLISLATRPTVSKEILANCGILVSFQNHMQKNLMRELLNLNENKEEYLSMLHKGQCIIRVNSIEKPFALQVPYIERSWLTNEKIRENNKRILENKMEKIKKMEKIEKTEHESKKTEKKLQPEQLKAEIIAKDVIDSYNKSFCNFCGAEIEEDMEYCMACKMKFEKNKNQIKELVDLVNELSEKQSKNMNSN